MDEHVNLWTSYFWIKPESKISAAMIGWELRSGHTIQMHKSIDRTKYIIPQCYALCIAL